MSIHSPYFRTIMLLSEIDEVKQEFLIHSCFLRVMLLYPPAHENHGGGILPSTHFCQGRSMSEPRNKPYKGKRWARVREKVLKDDKYLCQRCLGNYMPDPCAVRKRTPAVLVHHHFPVEEFPQWTYQKYVMINGETRRNLYSLCTGCHEYIHRDTHRPKTRVEHAIDFETVERWD